MPKFVFAHHVEKIPETEEEGAKVMDERMAWFEGPGDAIDM